MDKLRRDVMRRIARLSATGLVALGTTAIARRGRRTRVEGIITRATITIGRSERELYALWRDVGGLARFFPHVVKIEALTPTTSRWTEKAIGPGLVTWTSEIIADDPGRRIGWRSIEGPRQEGEVRFVPAPGGRGTEIHIELWWSPPGGRFGAAIASLAGSEAGQVLEAGLRRIKQWVETGEIATTEGQPHGGRPRRIQAGRPAARVAEAIQVLVEGGAS